MEILKSALFPLLIVFALCMVGLTIAALRNKVMFKMGARNVPRRPANTVLTCLGLMLAAMIFSASFATGDTWTHSIRTITVDSLGEVDIIVMREGTGVGEFQGQRIESSQTSSYFDKSQFDVVNESLSDLIADGFVDGVAPAIIESVNAISQETKLNEPSVTFLGFDHQYMEPFDPLLDEQGNELSLKNIDGNHVYINTSLAESLEVRIGDEFDVFFGETPTPLNVAGIYQTGGNPTTFSLGGANSIVGPLPLIQSLRGTDEINRILITNQGDVIDGAQYTDDVIEVLEPLLEETGLEANPVKQDGLDSAEESGAMFSTMFLVFGSFSIIAGVLLISLIFVMLAAERKQELGIARAIGTQRGHVTRMFTFEGALYALMASAIGSGLGLLVSWGMIQIMDAAFEEMGFNMVFHSTMAGLIISYVLGVVITLIVVFFSARRVSRLNIICAIKDIPEPQKKGSRSVRGLLAVIIGPLLGLLLLVYGLLDKQQSPYTLGASLLIIGLCMLARRFGLPDRPSYSLAGLGLLIFWLLPFSWHPYSDEMTGGMEMFILSGVMLVAGAVWVVMYNSDLLLTAIMSVFGRFRALAPILKTAISYPLASRFRTGMAMAMFSLIIFTLVVISTINASFDTILDDTDRIAGGFHIRADVSPNNPISDIEGALDAADGISQDDFQAIGSFNMVPVKMRDVNDEDKTSGEEETEVEWEDLYLAGVNVGFTENVSYDFELMTADYSSKEEAWEALSSNPSLAVVNSIMVPTRDTGFGDSEIGFVIGEGKFFLEDDVLPDDIYIEVQNLFTGEIQELQVIGVVEVMSGPFMAPVITSQDMINTLAHSTILPTSYRFQLRPEDVGNVEELAKNLEKAFLENGMNTAIMADEVKEFGQINSMFMNLMMAFMGLGLIVGIAALGVIAARSVVERRQQIGMLRAIDFRQGMVQFSFLLESSFIALLGIVLGVVLGITLAHQIIPSMGIEGITTVINWGQLLFIVVLAYVASLITTFIPAYKAARIYPAEALRYE